MWSISSTKARIGMLLAVVVLMSGITALVGCSNDGESSTPNGGASSGTIKIGLIPWDEDIAVSYLWGHLLKEEGYDVDIVQLDVAPVFSGLADGDLDLFLDTWLPVTHSDYWDRFGSELEQLGVWYDNALLTMVVPDYVEINSIDELVGNESMFGGRIIGIEPGSGLMRITREEVAPGYGLDGYELVEGSTTAMLAELSRATGNNEPIVATLWRPHWAYGGFPIKDLKDPSGLLGGAEEIHTIARSGFSEDHPEVAKWFSSFVMNDQQLAELSRLVIEEYGSGSEADAIEAWLSDPVNRALADSWLGK